jgi:hypothetical protein
MPRTRTIVVPLLLATALVGSAAPVVLAQDDVTTSAGINADRVDGKDAVSATNKKRARANKLVATDSRGYLPSNILTPLWSLIQGIPAILADGQVGWGEVLGMPASFADGVDDAGVTGVKVTRVQGPAVTIGSNDSATAFAACPPGSRVTGGGFLLNTSTDVSVSQSLPNPDSTGWSLKASYTGGAGTAAVLVPFAVCLSVAPDEALTVAKKGVLPAKLRKQAKRGR